MIVYICINNEADEGVLSSLRDGSDEDWLDELQLLGDEQLWRYGRGFSSYQAELYQELFLDVSSWHFGPPSAPLGDEDEDWDVCFEGFGEDEDHISDHDDVDEEEIIRSFLCGDLGFSEEGHLRGGAAGAATTVRKRQVNGALEELQKLLVEEAPTRDGLVQSLLKVVALLQGGDNDPPAKGNAKGSGAKGDPETKEGGASHLHGQSFYQAMQAMRQQQIERQKAAPRKVKKSSGKGVPELPRFDLKRSFPGLSFFTWQSLQQALEQV